MNLTTQITMTSLELVKFINESREDGDSELRHSDFLSKVPKVLKGDERIFSFVYMGQNGQERPCYKFPKREACLMAMSYSYELQAKVFDRMTELESIQRLKSVPQSTSIELEESRKRTLQSSAEWMCRMLNLEGSAKLAITEHTLRLTAPEHLKMLPAYAIDAPRTQDGKLISTGEGSSMTTAAASDLLRTHKVEMSSVKFNKLLEQFGFLETLERPSSSHPGAVRYFKGVTSSGLKFGKNLTNAKSQSETQPHWYREKFTELLSVLGL